MHAVELDASTRRTRRAAPAFCTSPDWMAEHEHPYLEKPEKLEFPTETWPAQDIRKSDVFTYAMLHASPADRARFTERGRFFHRYSVETLAARPTKALARPVVVLATSGFMQAWADGHADAAEPAVTVPVSFGPPAVFVPQRARAERRAHWIAAAGIVTVVVGLTLIFWGSSL